MKRTTAYLQMVLLVLAAAILGFYLLKKTPEQAVSAATTNLPNQTNAATFVYQSDLLNISRAPNEPVTVVDARIDKTGDLIIEVENISSRPVTYIGYYLAPAVCPKSVKPAAYWVGYGDQSVLSSTSKHKTDLPLDPSRKVTLTVSQKVYKGILKFQKSANCASSAKPELNLSRVVFNDRSGWQGFADGAAHSEWNGRFLPAEPK